MSLDLAQRLAAQGYEGYAYSYPHKTAYRPLSPKVPLSQAWSQEDTSSLFLYVHLPFCEMRCGFCNLFTTIRPANDTVEATLLAIERQSTQTAEAIAPGRVTQAAFGGGTPTYLSPQQIENLFTHLARAWPVAWGQVPLSVESSPATVSPEKLRLLRDLGVHRLSLGVQSFLPQDLAALRRPQLGSDLHRVIGEIQEVGFPTVNLDLIYGIPGQDEARWSSSLDQALHWRPEELYLYPLYIGPLTNLDRLGQKPGASRRVLYRMARERLIADEYRQVSMRLFRRSDAPELSADYCCQSDGMVGLGPGARSYTRRLHYSSEYAVGQPGVRAIISEFQRRTDFSEIDYGVQLDEEEEKRRYVIKSLLRAPGLNLGDYRARFASPVERDLPQLSQLLDLGLAEVDEEFLHLTADGLAHSDTIGPWLYSPAVQAGMQEFELR